MINIMWLVAPISLGIILFIILLSKLLIKTKKFFFSVFCVILIYVVLAFGCYYLYDIFFKEENISFIISLACIGIGAVINLVIVCLAISDLKKKNLKEKLLKLQYNLQNNLQIEDKWINILFSYSADKAITSDINEDLFSKIYEDNFEEEVTEIIEINKEIRIINENYKFLKKNLKRKYFFLKKIKNVTNLEDNEENQKLLSKSKSKDKTIFSLSKEVEHTIEIIKTLSKELLNLIRLEENEKTKNLEKNLAVTINYMGGILYNQLKAEKYQLKEGKLNELYSYIKAEKILLENIEELKENIYNYICKIKRKLREN